MGGGGLRILGHKKWHVWRRENIERVDRDEQQHAQQQRQSLLGQRRVEQDRRAHELEQQQQQHASEERERADDDTASVGEHVNFFKREQEELEQRQLIASETVAGKRGARHRSSRRSQDQKQQETLGKQGHLPWYAKPSEDVGADQPSIPKSRGEQKRKRALAEQDPLKHMRPRRSSSSPSSLTDGRDQKRSRDAEERAERVYKSDFSHSTTPEVSRKKSAGRNGSIDQLESAVKAHSPEREKKHKKTSRRREKESALQQLRREREERETKERQRAEALMGGR